ncbi:MAG: hypothetical protein ACI9ZF_002097 [Bradyrhizobium sp.]|jgi:hypothetical protein
MQTAVVIFIGRWSKKFNVGNVNYCVHPAVPNFLDRPFGWIRQNFNIIFAAAVVRINFKYLIKSCTYKFFTVGSRFLKKNCSFFDGRSLFDPKPLQKAVEGGVSSSALLFDTTARPISSSKLGLITCHRWAETGQ